MTLKLPPYIKLKPSKRARRLALRLDVKDRVFHLVKPSRISVEKAHAFAEQHYQWVRTKMRELPPTIPLEHGRVIPLLGYHRRININYCDTLKKTYITLKKYEILVETNLDDPTVKLKRFLRELAQETLDTLSREKAEMIGKRLDKVITRDTKSRWGSCSSDRQISYSWRLIFAPYEAMDYVVAHEVAHLKHMDHSPRFWDLCEELSHDFEEGNYWMRNHGHELMRYKFTSDK
jgi:predicted metal-dependent hydrolase